MKDIRIHFTGAYYGIWLEVRKFFSSDGFYKLEDAAPVSANRVVEWKPGSPEKFNPNLIHFYHSFYFSCNDDFRCFSKPLKLPEIILLCKKPKNHENKITTYNHFFDLFQP